MHYVIIDSVDEKIHLETWIYILNEQYIIIKIKRLCTN